MVHCVQKERKKIWMALQEFTHIKNWNPSIQCLVYCIFDETNVDSFAIAVLVAYIALFAICCGTWHTYAFFYSLHINQNALILDPFHLSDPLFMYSATLLHNFVLWLFDKRAQGKPMLLGGILTTSESHYFILHWIICKPFHKSAFV